MDTISLTAGRTRVLIAPEAGGRIVQIEILDGDAWLPLLVAPDDLQTLLDEPLLWGCYPMTPWPGRIDGARFEWQGTFYELPSNDGVHSIHGRGVYVPWKAVYVGEVSCRLEVTLTSSVEWPFPSRLSHEIRVLENGAQLALTVQNEGTESIPAGVGWHPWFRRDVRAGTVPRVRVAAAGHYDSKADLIPTGAVNAPSGDADLGECPGIEGRQLDDFYVGVRQPMEIRWGDILLTMTSSENCRHAVVYTQSDRGFCVEPQTCAPDAFNMAARGVADTGMSVVEPGGAMVARTELRWSIG